MLYELHFVAFVFLFPSQTEYVKAMENIVSGSINTYI